MTSAGGAMQAQCKRSWADLLKRFGRLCSMFRAAAHGLAVLDCLQSLAAVASAPNCCRPDILDDDPRTEDSLAGSPAPTVNVQGPGIDREEVGSRGEGAGGRAAGAPDSDAAGAEPCGRANVDGGPAERSAAAAAADGGPGEALIEIREGRAPVLDEILPQGAVPNDVMLRGSGLRAMCISGPNMGGKSSYMCQVQPSRDLALTRAHACMHAPPAAGGAPMGARERCRLRSQVNMRFPAPAARVPAASSWTDAGPSTPRARPRLQV